MKEKINTELRAHLHALEAAADIETYLKMLQDLIRTARRHEYKIRCG